MKNAFAEMTNPPLALKGLLRVDIEQLDKALAEARKRERLKAQSKIICPSVSAAGL
jgi:hypothetical protein